MSEDKTSVSVFRHALEKDNLLAAIKVARKRACCYMGDTCDCKYGASDPDNYDPLTYSGEQTGCPELREVIWLLHCMTEDQYADIVKTADKEQSRRMEKYLSTRDSNVQPTEEKP